MFGFETNCRNIASSQNLDLDHDLIGTHNLKSRSRHQEASGGGRGRHGFTPLSGGLRVKTPPTRPGPLAGQAVAMATKDDEPKPKSKTRQKIVDWFSVTNPDLWISIGVIAIVLVVVSAPRPPCHAPLRQLRVPLESS